MKTQLKYQIRRLVAAIILLSIFTLFTAFAIKKGLDNNFKYQDRILKEYEEMIEKWRWENLVKNLK